MRYKRSVSLLSLLSLLVLRATPVPADDVVDWRNAAQCVGRVCSIAGTVVEEKADGPVIRLYFDAERRDVYVTLIRGWLVTWPGYAGEPIVATGPVDRFRDHIEMIVTSPDNIVSAAGAPAVAPSETPAAPTAAASTPTEPAATATPVPPSPTIPAPTPGEVERLRERVHELEDRVRQLE
jgi:hypothetical protein